MEEHGKKFNDVKKYYDRGFWTKQMIKDAVNRKWITEKEYEEIVGEDYSK